MAFMRALPFRPAAARLQALRRLPRVLAIMMPSKDHLRVDGEGLHVPVGVHGGLGHLPDVGLGGVGECPDRQRWWGRPTSSKKVYSSSSSSAGAPSTMSCTRMPKATTSPCSSLAQGSRTVMPSAME